MVSLRIALRTWSSFSANRVLRSWSSRILMKLPASRIDCSPQGCLRTLIAVGGDGTAAELVNRTVPGLPLTVFPAGNENLLARHFGLGPTPEECCRTVVEGAMVQCDAGLAK